MSMLWRSVLAPSDTLITLHHGCIKPILSVSVNFWSCASGTTQLTPRQSLHGARMLTEPSKLTGTKVFQECWAEQKSQRFLHCPSSFRQRASLTSEFQSFSKRLFSTESSDSNTISSNENKENEDSQQSDLAWKLEYEGSLSGTIRTLKMVSLTTAALSLVGSPLYIMATMDGQYTAVKVMAATGFTCFGLFTTGLLHWFVGPYVHKLWHHAPSGQVKVELTSLFLQPMCDHLASSFAKRL